MNFINFLSAAGLYLLISLPTYATAVEEKNLNFMPKIQNLMKGDVHYSVELLDPAKLEVKYPDLSSLDSLGFIKNKSIKILIAKSVYMVEKPAGFFDHLNTGDERFLKHTFRDLSLMKISENHFKVQSSGETPYSYMMDTYFDSDEISTLPNAKVIRAVTQARRLDVISLSSSSTLFRESTKFSDFAKGKVLVSSFIPLKENRTLVISYALTAIKTEFAVKENLKRIFRNEILQAKRLTDNYKSQE